MVIKKIKIKDFRILKDIDLKFSENVNLIVFSGENGQGKSSIIEAIRYAFTGNLDEKIIDYIREGADEFFIQIVFNEKNIDYDFSVKSNGKETSKVLIFDDKDLRNSEAQEYLNDLLDSKVFDYAVFSMQGETANILFQKPTERLDSIKKIFNVNYLDEKTSSLVEKEKELKKEKEDNSLKLDYESKSLKEKQEVPVQKYSLKDIEENLKIELGKKEAYDRLMKEYDNEQENYFRAERDFKKVSENYNNYISYKKDIKSISIEEINDKELENLELEKKDIIKNRMDSQYGLKELEKKEKLSNEGKCPECGGDTKLERGHLVLLFENIDKEKEFIKNYLDKENFLENKIRDLKNKISINEKRKNDYKILESKIKLLEDSDIEKTYNELSSIKKPIAPDVKDNSSEVSLWEKNKLEHALLEKEINRVMELNKNIDKENEEKENTILTLKKRQDVISLELSMIKKVKKMLKDFTGYLITKGTDFIKIQMNNFFNEVYKGRYNVSYENTGNTINFFYGLPEKQMRSIYLASGFEKALLGISFRVALMEMKKTGILVLDEVDSFADSSKSEFLFKCILSYKNIKQVVIVTHNENSKEFLENEGAVFLELKEGVIT